MDGLDHWRICEEFSVIQAAMLIVGIDPSLQSPESMKADERPPRWNPTLTALKHAIPGKWKSVASLGEGWDEDPGEGEKLTEDVQLFPDQDEVLEEAHNTRLQGINIPSRAGLGPDYRSRWWSSGMARQPRREIRVLLPKWERSRERPWSGRPTFLDPRHPNYSAKLAAAIAAWQAVTDDPKLMRAKSVKAALTRWLRDNARKLRLTKKDGIVNEQAIEEIAKVANWDPKSGAPKAPGN
jgi:hypothetical protein